MKRLAVILLHTLLAIALAHGRAHAVDGDITKIDPPNAKQGQTVMLTISGNNLPQGGVSLDFFPQRIQLLKILSSSAEEIVAQVRIPQLAPAGSYNVLIYNHLGEEAFGEKMFSVDSDLVVPVIKDYDPKVIAEADNGFALLLTCDAISEAAVSHLNIESTKSNLELRRLNTVFTYAGPEQIVAAVSGALPEGSIRGKLMFDSMPIYLIELTIRNSTGAYVLGFSPAELEPVAGQEIKLIGSGFNHSFLEGLTIQLLHEDQPIVPTAKRVIDSNSITISFDSELQPGRYTLVVRQGEETLLLEDLTVKAAGLITQPTENGVSSNGSNLTEAPPVDNGNTYTPWQPSGNWQGTDAGDLISLSLVSSEMLPGADPARFTLQGIRLSELDADNLSYSLQRQIGGSELLFSGFTNSGITCIFGPEGEDWHAGERLELRVVDAANSMVPFSTELELGISGTRELASRPATPGSAENRILNSDWSVVLTNHEQGPQGTSCKVHLQCTADDKPEVALLNGDFTFIPDDPNYSVAFSNISYNGPLSISREGDSYLAEFTGLFVPGTIELSINNLMDPVLDTDIRFEFPLPVAMLEAGEVEGLNLDPASYVLDRPNLACSVDFAPFIPNSAELIRASLVPAPVVVQSLPQNSLEGSIVRISAPTGQWDAATVFGAGLQLRLDAGVKFDWRNGQSILYPVTQAEAVVEEISVSMPKRPVVMDGEGFTLIIQPRGPGSEKMDWTRVKLSSDNQLLNNNIDSFAVSSEASDFLGEPAVNLLFRRGRGLSAEAFSALADQLVDAGEVAITLYWDESKYSLQANIDFVH